MKVYVKSGVIFNEENNQVIDVILADLIATKNGFMYAERFVKAYTGKKLILDKNLKIEEVI